MRRAFTRAVSRRISECALTHLERQPIDAIKAAKQHSTYEKALEDAGFEIVRLPDLVDDPDAVFVEDTAILLDEHAVITRPGAPSRAGEAESTAGGLKPYFTVHRLASGTIDGGDVLRIGRTLYVGVSSRTNADGTAALRSLVERLGYRVVTVEPAKCLHLKTAVTFAGNDGVGRAADPGEPRLGRSVTIRRCRADPRHRGGGCELRASRESGASSGG